MHSGQWPLPGAAHSPGRPALGGALGPVFVGCSSGLADVTVHPLGHTAHQPCLLQTCEKHTVLCSDSPVSLLCYAKTQI